MDNLKQEVAKLIYPFMGNSSYRNESFYNSLIKRYGKKAVQEAIKEQEGNGNISDVFLSEVNE